MITISNYVEKIAEIGIDNLHPTLLEGHNFITKTSRNFTTWDFYNNPAYKDLVDTYLDKLNDYHSVKKDNKATIIKDFYNTLDKYQKAGISSGELPQDKVRLAETLGITLRDIQAYDSSVRKPEKQMEPAPENPKAWMKEAPKPRGQSFKQVEHLKEEVKYIKRYVALHRKIKTPNAILNFVKALQKSIIQKLITKDSPLVEEIRTIQDRLVKTYNKMKKPELLTIKDDELPKWVVIAGGEEVYPSINLIKRFVGLQGKPLQEKSLNAYRKAIESAKNKKKVIEYDPYLDKIQAIEKVLKKVKPGDTIELAKTSLNGLSGIVSACSCKHGSGKSKGEKRGSCNKQISPDAGGKGTCSHNRGLSGVITAEEMANRTYTNIQIGHPWNNLVANPAKNFVMMMHGEPGSGKTTLILKFSKYLAENFYKRVLYVTSEEFEATTMTMKVNELLIPRPANFDFAKDLNDVDLKKYDLVILDSINDLGLTLANFKELKKNNPDTAFILVLQVTKAGTFRGGKDWEHEVQIAAKVEAGTITVYKNRFGRLRNDALDFFEAA